MSYILKEYKSKDGSWIGTDLVHTKTGITLRKMHFITDPSYFEYKIINSSGLLKNIQSQVYDMIYELYNSCE